MTKEEVRRCKRRLVDALGNRADVRRRLVVEYVLDFDQPLDINDSAWALRKAIEHAKLAKHYREVYVWSYRWLNDGA